MKILLLADHMENGGAETHIYELSRFLFRLGHCVTVLSYGGRVANALAAQGICQETYGAFPLIRLTEILKKQKPDIVHAHTRKSAFLCRLLLSYKRFPFVFTAHACFAENRIKDSLSFFPKRTIAVSKDIAEHLIHGFGVSSEKITVIPNGIDPHRFCPGPPADKTFQIVTVSRLDKDCSLTAELLCHIAPRLSREIPEVHITVVGGGNDLGRIRHLAAQANTLCGRNVVTAVGQKYDVLPYLQKASVFVGVSRAALEAMSCGVPVILSGNEGYLGIAEGRRMKWAELGNFCARGRQKPTRECILRDILSLFSDPALSFRAREDGVRQIALSHTAKQMAEATLGVYHAAIRDKQREQSSDILLCGYYGYGNLGDELSLRAICARLSDKKFATALALPRPRLSILLPKNTTVAPFASVDRLNPLAITKAMQGTGLFLLGGGSLLQNKTSNRSLFYYLMLLELAHLLGVPSMLYASGIGPIHGKTPQKLCQIVLKNTTRISVRDLDSFTFLRKLGITKNLRLSADPVLFLNPPAARSNGYLLVFARKEELGMIYSFLKTETRPIHLAVMDKRSDMSITKKLAHALQSQGKTAIVFEDDSPKNILSLIQGADLVISSRLHALILAFSMGVPFVGVSNDPKITAFVRAAYQDCPSSPTRESLAQHFRRKKKEMLALAQVDAIEAIRLTNRQYCLDKH